jgi:hypothetical protein
VVPLVRWGRVDALPILVVAVVRQHLGRRVRQVQRGQLVPQVVRQGLLVQQGQPVLLVRAALMAQWVQQVLPEQ